MMKITKSSPISKRDRVKNELYMYMIEIQILTDISLTAMGLAPTVIEIKLLQSFAMRTLIAY